MGADRHREGVIVMYSTTVAPLRAHKVENDTERTVARLLLDNHGDFKNVAAAVGLSENGVRFWVGTLDARSELRKFL